MNSRETDADFFLKLSGRGTMKNMCSKLTWLSKKEEMLCLVLIQIFVY
jgi:hypothetical protein